MLISFLMKSTIKQVQNCTNLQWLKAGNNTHY